MIYYSLIKSTFESEEEFEDWLQGIPLERDEEEEVDISPKSGWHLRANKKTSINKKVICQK